MTSPGTSGAPTRDGAALLRGTAEPLLRFEHVTFGYQGSGRNVLKDVSFDVLPREFVCLVGPSGCGKSTLMNLTAGLIHPVSGRVVFEGRTQTGVNSEVGYMTQSDTLLPWRTVRENLLLPMELAIRRGTPRAEIEARITRLLQLANLTGAADLFPAQLSGGMKRRALLARSLVYQPKLLLMDEPFAALDAQMRATLHQDLIAMVRRLDQTVLFITHDINEAILLSDRVVSLGGHPSEVVGVTEIPFGTERDPRRIATLREFGEVSQRLWRLLGHSEDAPPPAPEPDAVERRDTDAPPP